MQMLDLPSNFYAPRQFADERKAALIAEIDVVNTLTQALNDYLSLSARQQLSALSKPAPVPTVEDLSRAIERRDKLREMIDSMEAQFQELPENMESAFRAIASLMMGSPTDALAGVEAEITRIQNLMEAD